MLFPIGIENDVVRRIPFVSFSIIAICCFVWLVQLATDDHAFERAIAETFSYFAEHPYLELPEDLRRFVRDQEVEEDLSFLDESAFFQDDLNGNNLSASQIQEEQEHLNQLAAKARTSLDQTFFRKWGYIPAKSGLWKAITGLFVHSGFYHLLSNMLFFYFAAIFLEDRWGRPFFAAFYLLSGVGATLLWRMHFPTSNIPLVGASGAVAAVMGAFFVKFSRERITFLFLLFFTAGAKFKARAWVILPLFFMLDLMMARLTEGSGGEGVAYWAHVWGFLLGILTGTLLKLTGWETKLSPTGFDPDNLMTTPVESAFYLESQGKPHEAVELLKQASAEKGNNLELARQRWSFTKRYADEDQATEAAITLLNLLMPTEHAEESFRLLQEIHRARPFFKLAPQKLAVLARKLIRQEKVHLAQAILERVATDTRQLSAPQALVLAKVAAMIDSPLSGGFAQRGLESAGASPEERKALIHLAGKRAARECNLEEAFDFQASSQQAFCLQEPADQESHPKKVSPPGTDETQHLITEGIPLALTPQGIEVQLERGPIQGIKLSDLKAICMAAIRPDQGRPYLVLDLIHEGNGSPSPAKQILRMRANRFDPCKLFPLASNPQEGFFGCVRWILDNSKARPYPNEEAIYGNQLLQFTSLTQMDNRLYALQKAPAKVPDFQWEKPERTSRSVVPSATVADLPFSYP